MPLFDQQTLRLLHTKVLKDHADMLNVALSRMRSDPSLRHFPKMGIDGLLPKLGLISEQHGSDDFMLRQVLRRSGGCYVNMQLFFESVGPLKTVTARTVESLPSGMAKPDDAVPSDVALPLPVGPLLHSHIMRAFGTADNLRATMRQQCLGIFGSGWCFLTALTTTDYTPPQLQPGRHRSQGGEGGEPEALTIYDGGEDNGDGVTLTIVVSSQHDSPLMDESEAHRPLLAVSMWEHAHLSRFGMDRAAYFDEFWALIDWDAVNQRFITGEGHLPLRTKPPHGREL